MASFAAALTFTSGAVTLSAGAAHAVEWGPNVRLVYAHQCDIFLAHPSGTARVNLTADVADCAGRPSLSRTGRYVAYTRYSGTGLPAAWLHDIATHEHRQLTALGASAPDFSPTSDTITFGRYLDQKFDLFTVEVDGTGVRNWTNDPGGEDHYNLAPRWSADGESLLYQRAQDTRMCREDMGGYHDLYYTHRLYRIDRAGQLTQLAGSDEYSIVGGHDGGGRLAYVRTPIPPTDEFGMCAQTPVDAFELVVDETVIGPATPYSASVSDTGDVAYSNGSGNVLVVPAGTTAPQVLFPGSSPDWGPAYSASTDKVATTTTMTVPTTVQYGGRTLVASVTAASGTPAGSVRFTLDGKQTVVALTNGKASLSLPAALPLGAHSVRAEYLGSGTHAGSVTTLRSFTVKAASVLKGRLPSLTWRRGTDVFITLTLTTTPAVTAAGTMTLKDGTKTIASALLKPAHGNRLRMRVPTLAVGPHALRVTFGKSPTVMNASTGTARVQVTR
jgi:hypothetical protein